ncbi:MAG: hypothetical protein IVW36_02595 [Dehalococcoidia bacterium]|nr:hypothetical protein [Dehalococcoidia bacterium]
MNSTDYAIPTEAAERLDALVTRIEARPGDMIRAHEFASMQDRLNVRAVIETLPEGLSEDDFAGVLKLALLTECATETYGDAFRERAVRYDASWLGRFNDRVWVPDELTHHTPYRSMLLSMGLSDAELDREIRDVRQANYIHDGGDTPVHVTTFGIVQEYLTDNWHGLIAGLLRKAAPEAAYMATRVKRRETLHTVWYRDMVALQVEANPLLLPHVAEALLGFQMPGNQLAPQWQSQVSRWMPYMGADFERIARDLVRLLHTALGDAATTGRLLVELAAAKGFRVGPVSPRVLQAAANRLGGPGFGLLGEALLERVGLAYMFRQPAGATDRAFRPYGGVYERVRAMLRSWVSQQIDFRLGVGPPADAPVSA